MRRLPQLSGSRPVHKRPTGLARAYRHVFGGYGMYTSAKAKAILSIGLRRGFGAQENKLIDPEAASEAVFDLRKKQVGFQTAGTIFPTTGYYKGTREPSMRVDIAFIPDKRERSPAQFVKNVKSLAQGIASALDQREVLVEWEGPGRSSRIESATPEGAPPPTSPKFCAWVRGRSASAQSDPKDACYEPPKRKRRR